MPNVNLFKRRTKSTIHTQVFPTLMCVSKNENVSNFAKVWRVVGKGGKYCASVGQSLRQTATFLELYWNARQTLTFRRHHSQSLQCQSIHCQTYNRPRNSVLFKFIECLNSINNLYSNLSFINKHIRTFWKTLCKLYLGLVASEWQDDDLTCNSFF